MRHGSSPIIPRDGRKLKVIRVARISTVNQDEKSLDDQLVFIQQELSSFYQGEIEYTDITSQGSGEALDRIELFQLEEYIESGFYDLVVSEDLGRISRRTRAIDICESCIDHETRLIALNDHIDTIDDDWKDRAMMVTWHHERSNKDTSNRIKRSHRNRFANGSKQNEYGPFYIVPDGAKMVSEVQKNASATDIVEQGFSMLEQGATYQEVADMINDKNFPVGGQSKQKKWNGRLVKTRFLNPILKGVELRNKKKNVRKNGTGRYQQKPSDPDEVLTREVKHLAYIHPDRFDYVKLQMQKRNDVYSRSKSDPLNDPCRNRPKKRTPFPGQMVNCGVCGRKYVFGGHGRKEFLMCDGARQHKCWNGTTFDGRLAAIKVATSVLEIAEQLPEFDNLLLEQVRHEAEEQDSDRQNQIRSLRLKEIQLCQEIGSLIDFVSKGDSSEGIRQKLKEKEDEYREVKYQLTQLESAVGHQIEIPDATTLRNLAHNCLDGVLPFSWEFNQIARKMITNFIVQPVRLIDGGHIELLGRFQLNLAKLYPDDRVGECFRAPLMREMTLKFFTPPQREEFRKAVIFRRNQSEKEREVATALNITQTAVQRAAALQRMMDARGIDEPYQLITEPPEDYSKLRRHKHPRYRFEPLSSLT
ncbi:recombinase family protein [uncultured Rubinisphaera sp.]|uniref:recombinase family protein n=1 Tax=uncultured Rubinisphaera sp. TaxID=1678686 RepID=UPI0030DD2574